MHYAKYAKTAVGAILQHSDRGIDSPDTHKHSNEDIDRSRTHLNYDLKDRGGLTAYQYYKQKIDQIAEETKERTGKNIRKDAVTLCSWAVTLPKDVPEDRQDEFFKGVYDWFAERYGEDNIVTAAVHKDETTPHLHFQFVPIIEKDGIRKLCAKEIETRKSLGTVHQTLQKSLERTLGCGVGLLNGATDNGNRSVLQLKLEGMQKEVGTLEQTLEDKTRAVNEQVKRAETLTLDDKKGLLESKKAYEQRQALYTRERLADEREQSLKQREMESEQTARKAVLIVGNAQQYAKSEEQRLKDERQKLAEEKAKMQQEIEQRAQELANRQMQEMFGGVATKREQRLEDFCAEITFDDGTSVLDAFEERERALKVRANRGR